MTEQAKNVNRRNFLQFVSKAAIVLPLAGLGVAELSGLFARPSSALRDKAKAPWNISIASASEPGEPLIISGTIYAPDGHTPLEGISLWVCLSTQTRNGPRTPKLSDVGGEARNTRLHGLMQTNREGRYEFRTIKPAPYPGRTNPAHVHAYVSGPGYPEYWIATFSLRRPFPGDASKFAGKGKLLFSGRAARWLWRVRVHVRRCRCGRWLGFLGCDPSCGGGPSERRCPRGAAPAGAPSPAVDASGRRASPPS